MKFNQLTFIAAFAIVTAIGCKKTPVTPIVTPEPTPTNPVASRADLSRDSIFLYAKEVYYWNDKLPTYTVFNPRQYKNAATDLANYENELFEITKYSNPFEYKTGGTSSKYSYIFDKADKNPTASLKETASVDLEGNGNDIGLRLAIFLYNNDPGYLFYIGGIYENSPAEKAGLTRGDLIKKINGVNYGANYNGELTSLNAVLSSSSMTIEGIKENGTPFTVTLTKSVFKSNPIYKSKVISAGAKKVGYVSYARFSNAENSVEALTNTFNSFATEGVTDLIIDLRYNGGGYVSTAQHLIDLIAPSSASGKVMFAEYYNATMQAGKASILKNQPLLDDNGKLRYRNGVLLTYADADYSVAGNTEVFAKKGNLNNLKNVVFLVSGNTASASELVINSLKPHMTVSLVGRTTYGKPIGFFPITIENKYDVYFSLFETKNSAGEGAYYDGLVPTVTTSELINDANNNVVNKMYDFGDVRDGYIKAALNILAPNVVVTSQAKTASVNVTTKKMSATELSSNAGIFDKEFKGMIENRFKTKN